MVIPIYKVLPYFVMCKHKFTYLFSAGSGKTYTIEGTKESLGIIPRAAEQIFYRILTTVDFQKNLL